MHQICSTLNRGRPAAPLVLRIVIGGLFIWHGIDTFDVGISMIEEMFTMWGVPAPGLTAPLTAVVEIVAGIMLVVGLGTRVAAMMTRPTGAQSKPVLGGTDAAQLFGMLDHERVRLMAAAPIDVHPVARPVPARKAIPVR